MLPVAWGVNHPGVLAGLHSQGLDGAGHNQWVVDDAPGQLRTRLSTSYAGSELGLGHLITQTSSPNTSCSCSRSTKSTKRFAASSRLNPCLPVRHK